MVLGALGCMSNADFEKKKCKCHIAYRVHFSTSVSACGTHFYAILRRSSLKILQMVHFLSLFLSVTQAVSIPFCMTVDLQPNFYGHLCYNSRVHSPLLQPLRTTSAILAGAHYFAVSFKCEGKNSCHDLIPNPRIYSICIKSALTFYRREFCSHWQTLNHYYFKMAKKLHSSMSVKSFLLSTELKSTAFLSLYDKILIRQ